MITKAENYPVVNDKASWASISMAWPKKPKAQKVWLLFNIWPEKVCQPWKRRGFIFVGIDVIGDYMTEINVTSPTGIREVKKFGGADIAGLFWDAVEDKRK